MDFEELFKTYYMQVYSYVMTLSGNPDQSEEITQRTFFKALTALKQYEGNSSLFTWLCAIAKNLYIDEWRRRPAHALPDADLVSDADLESTVMKEEDAFRIHQILHHLEEPYKEVFQLRVFGELSFHKIGTLFQKTDTWARVTYHRARLKIQERMEQ